MIGEFIGKMKCRSHYEFDDCISIYMIIVIIVVTVIIAVGESLK